MNVCLFTNLPANNATFQDLYFDKVHPSLKGTYLQGLIITGAITGNLLHASLSAQYSVVKVLFLPVLCCLAGSNERLRLCQELVSGTQPQ